MIRHPTPPSYVRATWRTVLPADAEGRQGIAFDLADGTVVRLSIDADTAWHLFDLLRHYRSGDPRFRAAMPGSSATPPGHHELASNHDHADPQQCWCRLIGEVSSFSELLARLRD